MSETTPIYIFDTSAIIDMHKFYPINRVFPYWRNVDFSISMGRFRAPLFVLLDIERKDDDIKKWFSSRKSKMAIMPGDFQNNAVKIIERDHKGLVNYRFDRMNADPFVIACALDIINGNQTILTQEKQLPIIVAQEGERKKESIPKVCKKMGLTCISIDQLWEGENWVVK
jgi:hypothetical protein